MIEYNSLQEIHPELNGTAVAIGFFDGLHIGHQAVIRAAIARAEEQNLTPAVFTFDVERDSLPTRKPIGKRIMSPSLFREQLEKLNVPILYNLPFGELRGFSPEDFAKEVLEQKIGTRFVSCGRNFHFGKGASGAAYDLARIGWKLGFEVEALPIVTLDREAVSSTRIRELIEKGDMAKVAAMLGRRYAVDFPVVEGNRIGRTLGAPTINQPYPDGYAVPKFGVYASLTLVDGTWHTSVTNVGVKPTVGSDRVLAETYIQNYQGDLYGRQVQVELVKFLREETKFENIEALRDQINEDSRQAAEIGSRLI
ncbi:MAG: riboflavin biosynthesis protein RibF [Oscillospiraceae bacterium]